MCFKANHNHNETVSLSVHNFKTHLAIQEITNNYNQVSTFSAKEPPAQEMTISLTLLTVKPQASRMIKISIQRVQKTEQLILNKYSTMPLPLN